jgi:hypothetical protein
MDRLLYNLNRSILCESGTIVAIHSDTIPLSERFVRRLFSVIKNDLNQAINEDISRERKEMRIMIFF